MLCIKGKKLSVGQVDQYLAIFLTMILVKVHIQATRKLYYDISEIPFQMSVGIGKLKGTRSAHYILCL